MTHYDFEFTGYCQTCQTIVEDRPWWVRLWDWVRRVDPNWDGEAQIRVQVGYECGFPRTGPYAERAVCEHGHEQEIDRDLHDDAAEWDREEQEMAMWDAAESYGDHLRAEGRWS